MTSVKAQFLFDFGSPNAYLASKVVPEIEKRTGIQLERVPILLGGVFKLTNNKSPVETFAGVKNKPEFMRVEMQRFVQRHGISEFRMNPFFPINTLQLMRGAIAAQMLGIFDPFYKATFHYMWEDPRKMDDLAAASQAYKEAGIDGGALFSRAQEADVKGRLAELTQSAVDRGAFGAPTFFIDDEMFFGKDQLRDVEEAVVAAQSR